MKTAKQVLCIVMAVVMTLLLLPVAAFAREDSAQLQFGSDGKFKIMVYADIQDDENVEESTIALMNETLKQYQPDLVVFLGDNTVAHGYDNQYKAIETITEPCLTHNIPYAIVFGNHDQEQGVDKEDLLEIYQNFGCLTYEADPDMYGCGTCNLPILSSDGMRVAFNLWLIDSGSRNPDKNVGGYDYVHEDQIEWYKNTSAQLKEANGGVIVPSFNFQHIVIPEIYDALGYATVSKPVIDRVNYTVGDKNYLTVLPKFSAYESFLLEHPCPPNVFDGQFDAWMECGDVLASFFGHDHTNSFVVNYKGVDLINVPTAGCNSYYKDENRGAVLLTVDENDPANYTYELIHAYDVALTEGSQMTSVNSAKSKAHYVFYKILTAFLERIHEMIRMFSF